MAPWSISSIPVTISFIDITSGRVAISWILLITCGRRLAVVGEGVTAVFTGNSVVAGDGVMDGVTLMVPADGTGAHDASRKTDESRSPKTVLRFMVNGILETDVYGLK